MRYKTWRDWREDDPPQRVPVVVYSKKLLDGWQKAVIIGDRVSLLSGPQQGQVLSIYAIKYYMIIEAPPCLDN